MYFFLEDRQDILSKQEFLHLEQWFKTFLNSLPLQMQDELHPSHKIGRFFIGHIGWYGVLQRLSSLEIFPEEELFVKQY